MTTINQFRFIGLFSLAFIVAITAGCSEPKQPSGDLTGTVLSNGENVGDCIVSLYNLSTKKNVGGKVNEEGKFLITELSLGDYSIAVLQRTSNNPEPEPFDKRIPKKYRNRKTSGFEVTIVEGDNSTTLEME